MNQIKLGKNQGAALKAELLDIQKLEQNPAVIALGAKRESFQRNVESIVLDSGSDTKDFQSCGLWEEGGAIYLRSNSASVPELLKTE